MRMTKAIARVFGDADGTMQAELINALGAALWNSCSRDPGRLDTQCCYIESDLDEHGKRFVKTLGAFVEDPP